MKKNKNTLGRFFLITFKEDKLYYLFLILSSLISLSITLIGALTISLILKYVEIKNLKFTLIISLFIALIEASLLLLKKFIDSKTRLHEHIIKEKIDHLISKKIMELPFSYLENPSYQELKENARMGINNMGAIYSFVNGVLNIFTNVITLITLGAIVATFDYRLLISLFLSFILILIITLLSSKTQIKFYKELLPINFKFGYYLNILTSTKNSKDFRIYDSIFNCLDDNFNYFEDKTNKYLVKINIRLGLMECLISLVRYISLGYIYILSTLKVLNKTISLSSFSLIISSSISFSSSVSSLLQEEGNFMRSLEYVKPLLELMDVKEDKNEGNKHLNKIETIEFKNVTFTYPGTSKKVLDNVSFIINKNEKISIVGLNGAGKTTIVKLICKLYKPETGSILINNINIDEYKYEDVIKEISSVFQDFKLFAYSIKENIGENISEESAIKLCNEVGLKEKIDSLERGIYSDIGKEYEEKGIELSGGQEQKIAIARAIYKPSSLLIMDEPTSALDPLSECEIYENFNRLAKGKMALYISHRMSSSIFCDKILVLNNGKVEDFAPHKELMKKKNSLYYKLFSTQAKNYNM